MFQTPEWPSDQEGDEKPQHKKKKIAKCIPEVTVTSPTDTSIMSGIDSSKKKKKKKKKKTENEPAEPEKKSDKSDFTSGIRKKFDRALNSPSMTKDLLGSSPELKRKTSEVSLPEEGETEPTSKRKKLHKSFSSSLTSLSDAVSESASQVGSLLTRGIRFTSESEFVQFVSGKSSKKKKKKKKHGGENVEQTEKQTEEKKEETDSPSKKKKKKKKKKKVTEDASSQPKDEKTNGMEAETESTSKKKKKKKKAKKAEKTNGTDAETDDKASSNKKKEKTESINEAFVPDSTPKSGIKKAPNFDIAKLKAALYKEEVSKTETPPSGKSFGSEVAKNKLKSSQFRYLNEKLYSQIGAQSLKMFTADKEAFRIYHEGYSAQVKKWPKDPLNIIINAIVKDSGNPVVADFGCGEARLARAVSTCCKKVHSFDLVAANELVTAGDMAHTTLESSSVDIAVFCLSLMGTNLRDFIREASRVLKVGGILKIAEVESRFQDLPVDQFTSAVERCGFKLKLKDLSNKYFYLFDFTKTDECKKKVPEFSLKPCYYKKR